MNKLYKLDISKKKISNQDTIISRKSSYRTTDSEIIEHLLNDFKYDPSRTHEVLSKYENLTEMDESQSVYSEYQKVQVPESYGKRQRIRKCFKKK